MDKYREKYLISFSGGRTSAFMTNELLKDAAIADNCAIVFCNTGRENDATLDFVHNCDQVWGGKVVWLEYCPDEKFKIVTYETAHRVSERHRLSPFEKLIRKRKMLPNAFARFCTQELKVRPIKHYLLSFGWQYWTNIIGIRYDEPLRYSIAKEIETKERWLNWYPLYHWRTTKPHVLAFWHPKPFGFDLEIEEKDGNCDGCFLKGKAKKKAIIQQRPQQMEWWMDMEWLMDATWHKSYSIAQLIQMVNSQPELFTEDVDVPCLCNVD